MEKIMQIAQLLGEDNVKRLKDGIVDMLIEFMRKELEDEYAYNFVINYDSIFDEIKQDIEREVRDKMSKEYKEKLEKKMREFLETIN